MDGLLQFLLFGGAIFLMMRFGCGAHMSGHGAGHNKDNKSGAHGGGCGGGAKKDAIVSKQENQAGPPKQDTDPVCGNLVSTKKAKTSLHNGLVYFFCSTECREVFEISPNTYAVRENEVLPLPHNQNSMKDSNHV